MWQLEAGTDPASDMESTVPAVSNETTDSDSPANFILQPVCYRNPDLPSPTESTFSETSCESSDLDSPTESELQSTSYRSTDFASPTDSISPPPSVETPSTASSIESAVSNKTTNALSPPKTALRSRYKGRIGVFSPTKSTRFFRALSYGEETPLTDITSTESTVPSGFVKITEPPSPVRTTFLAGSPGITDSISPSGPPSPVKTTFSAGSPGITEPPSPRRTTLLAGSHRLTYSTSPYEPPSRMKITFSIGSPGITDSTSPSEITRPAVTYGTLVPYIISRRKGTIKLKRTGWRVSVTQGPIINIYAGPEKTHVPISRRMICHYSKKARRIFAEIGNGCQFKNGVTNGIVLTKHPRDAVFLLLNWIHLGKVEGLRYCQSIYKNELGCLEAACLLLCRFSFLVKYLEVIGAELPCLEELEHINLQVKKWMRPSYTPLKPALVTEVLDNTPENSRLHRLIIKELARRFPHMPKAEQAEYDICCTGGRSFSVPLCLAIARNPESKASGDLGWDYGWGDEFVESHVDLDLGEHLQHLFDESCTESDSERTDSDGGAYQRLFDED